MTIISGWDLPKPLLASEFTQKHDEGFIIPENVKKQFDALGDNPSDGELEAVWNGLAAAAHDPKFPYVQPNGLDAIRAERPDAVRRTYPVTLSDDALADRFHGAWTGRCVGCALGKPVEGLGMGGRGGLPGRASIRAMLEQRGEWPLRDYFAVGNAGDVDCPLSCRENIRFMEPDDDIHYTLVALRVLEQFGADFTWQDVANTWNTVLPYNAICTAETQAILNYNIKTPRNGAWNAARRAYCTADFTSSHNNPYREWIGAQIRADAWGYVCAGNPERAAEFAWRDAHWTHRANGIYGAMFIAAVTAAAFSVSDWHTLMNAGLAEIPRNSRLAEALRWTLDTAPACSSPESFMDLADRRFAGLSPVHTINNCVICAMSVYFGAGDPERTAEIAVSAGLDTDCNGATAGSIAGILAGRAAFDGHLADRLNDTIHPNVFGFQEITMTELARRTFALFRKFQR